MNDSNWLKMLSKVAIPVTIVAAMAVSLWYAAPQPVQALDVTYPTLPAGSVGSTHTFSVSVDVMTNEVVPIQSIDVEIYNTADPTVFKATATNLPLAPDETKTYNNTDTGNGGTITVTSSCSCNNWSYFFTGAGYANWEGSSYHFGPTFGYGYAGGGKLVNMTYNGVWVSPATWPAGTYKVKVTINAQSPALTANFIKNSNTFALDSAGFVTGIITAAGVPVANVQVNVYTATSNQYVAGIRTAADGTYNVKMPPGVFIVRAIPSTTNLSYVNEYYGGAYVWNLATPVTVTSGNTTPNINIGLDPAGFITGIITGDGMPLNNITVNVYNGTSNQLVTGVRTAANGTYKAYVPGGTFVVRAIASNNNTSYVDMYYGGTYVWNIATLVAVTSGNTTPNIDIALETGGFISGSITSDGIFVPNVQVNAYTAADNQFVAGVRTTTNGTYKINVPPGTFIVLAQPSNTNLSYVNEYYGGVSSWTVATRVNVTLNNPASNTDIEIDEGGFISGNVTAGSLPLANVSISVSNENGVYITSISTGSNGSYRVTLPAGDYRLAANPNSTGLPYAIEHYVDRHASDGFSFISVTVGATTNANFNLDPAAFITGTITAGGMPLANVTVQVLTATNNYYVGGARTIANGTYILNISPSGSNEADGRYIVLAKPSLTGLSYTNEFYSSTGAAYSGGQATVLIAGVPGATISNINIDLDQGGVISGRVFDQATGQAILGAKVSGSLYGSFATLTQVTTNSSGHYQIRMPAGRNIVGVSADGYATEWYENLYGNSLAMPITVSDGATTFGIDFSMGPGTTISGHVYQEDGVTPISGANVQIALFDGGVNQLIRNQSGADGYYSITGVAPGTYIVKAFAPSYIHQLYNSKEHHAQADNVTVGYGPVTGIDFRLKSGAGSIAGYVYESDNITTISERAFVEAYAFDGVNWILDWATRIGEEGSYGLAGMKPGLYKVKAYGIYDGEYVPEWYQNSQSESVATLVTVTALTDTPNVSFTLSRLYETLAGANVTVADVFSGTQISFAEVTDSGNTSVIVTEVPPAPTDGFTFLNTYFDVVTSASYSGNITLTITYTEADIPPGLQEQDLRLYHYTGGVWEDTTISLDTVNNLITGSVSSLSWLGIAGPPKVIWLPPLSTNTLYTAQDGSTIPIKFQLTDTLGKQVTDASVLMTITQDSSAATIFAGTVVYDSAIPGYKLNVQTKDWALGYYTIRISANKESKYGLIIVANGQAKGKQK